MRTRPFSYWSRARSANPGSLRPLCVLGELCVQSARLVIAKDTFMQSSQSSQRPQRRCKVTTGFNSIITAFLLITFSINCVPAAPPMDWSKGVVDTLIKKNPTGESWKGWGYAKSLALYGEYLVYLRTHDKKYL